MTDASAGNISVERLAEDFLKRKRKGKRPAVAEYLARYPHLADEIRNVFPVLGLVEDFKPGSGDATGSLARAEIPGLEKPPDRLGDFRLLRVVGRGGMGIVYEAEQVSLGRHVALKVLPNQALKDAKQKRRFEREAQRGRQAAPHQYRAGVRRRRARWHCRTTSCSTFKAWDSTPSSTS